MTKNGLVDNFLSGEGEEAKNGPVEPFLASIGRTRSLEIP